MNSTSFKILLLFFLALSGISYSQISDSTHKHSDDSINVIMKDTALTRSAKKDTLISFDANKIVKNNVMSVYSDTTGYDAWIWNDKRTLGEILNEKPGYLINTFGGSGRDAINYFGGNRVGIYKDGIPLNDVYTDGFDLENISVNEIDKIEEISPALSFLYGPYSSNGAVNIVTKDRFVPNMFTQLRYTQDRDGALYADFNMNFPVSRKFSLQFGLNNHGTDGHYSNSDFALWRGRIRLNYYPSDRINFNLNFYQNKLQRGLNEGLAYSTSDTLLDPKLAAVNNNDAYEKWTNNYTDLQTTLRLFNDRNSLTKIQIYTHNLTRAYRDEENRISPNGIFIQDDYHYMLYGLNVNQNLFVKFSKDAVGDLNVGYSSTYNLANYNRYYSDIYSLAPVISSGSYNTNLNSVFGRLDLKYAGFLISGGIRGDYYSDNRFVGFGGQAEYNFRFNDDFSFKLIAGGSYYKYKSMLIGDSYYEDVFTSGINEIGFAITYDNFYAKLLVRNLFSDKDISFKNLLADVSYRTKYFDFLANATTLGGSDVEWKGFPGFYFKSDLSFHDYLFDNKLHLRTGFNIKYMNALSALYYYPRFNVLGYPYIGSSSGKDNNFNVDFYIGARIGKANINITFANLFNTLFYDTYIYPWDNRGGFLKSLSRFTITWDFWN